nr:ABC-three component system middle component 6 [Fusobacterium sp.]
MIMPDKNTTISESIIGLGAFVLSILEKPLTIDDCWNKLNKKYIQKGKIQKKHTFDTFILTIDFLYIMNSIDINERGEIYNVLK